MRSQSVSKGLFILVFLSSPFLLAACGTSQQATSNMSRKEARAAADLIAPQILIQQISRTPIAARHVTGPLPINFRLSVLNHSPAILTLTRVRVESMGEGAYTLISNSQAFNKRIDPAQEGSVEFWVPAQAERTILGSNGPVTIRGIAYFNSPTGKFQKVFVQQVHDQIGRIGVGY